MIKAKYILINDERKTTERELVRIQGFTDDYKIVGPYGKIKKKTGNAVAVPVIKAGAREMIAALKKFHEHGGNENGESSEIERFQTAHNADPIPDKCVS